MGWWVFRDIPAACQTRSGGLEKTHRVGKNECLDVTRRGGNKCIKYCLKAFVIEDIAIPYHHDKVVETEGNIFAHIEKGIGTPYVTIPYQKRVLRFL